jgi:hypothetical protein
VSISLRDPFYLVNEARSVAMNRNRKLDINFLRDYINDSSYTDCDLSTIAYLAYFSDFQTSGVRYQEFLHDIGAASNCEFIGKWETEIQRQKKEEENSRYRLSQEKEKIDTWIKVGLGGSVTIAVVGFILFRRRRVSQGSRQ